MKSVTFRCFSVEQNLGDFYVCSHSFRELLLLLRSDPRRWAEDDTDKMVGVQREIKPKRVTEIAEYVGYDYAIFPTSVVIALDEDYVSERRDSKCADVVELEVSVENYFKATGVRIEDLSKAGYIIDGQHRLSGLSRAADEIDEFKVNVSIFTNIDPALRAEVFATVNLTQSKVNKSLGYDLFAYQVPPSPFRSAHDVVVALDKKDDSPFHQRVKRLGVASENRPKKSERLSQATIVKGLLRYLPGKPAFERQKGLRGRDTQAETRESPKVRILAPFYRQRDTAGIIQLYLNYFRAVEDRWPIAWADEDFEYMLCSTNGFNGLNKFLRDLYLRENRTPQEPMVPKRSAFLEHLNEVDINDEDFVSKVFLPGSSGESRLYRSLRSNRIVD